MKLAALKILMGVIVINLGLIANIQARPGDMDNTFGYSGVQVFDCGSINHQGEAVANDDFRSFSYESDGSMLLSTASYSSGCIIRALNNGPLDSSFGSRGIVRMAVTSFGTQSDGKIVTNTNRLSAGGNVDPTFPLLFMQRGLTRTIALKDDKILLLNSDTDFTNDRFYLQRLMPNGTPDTSFGVSGNGLVEVTVARGLLDMKPIIIDQDEKIWVGGGLD